VQDPRRFLTGFVILDMTDAVAHRFGMVRRILRNQGNLIPDMDLIIAATALPYDHELLTRNARHVSRVPGLTFYEIRTS
jgi:predicted nucleic acid-binding protein